MVTVDTQTQCMEDFINYTVSNYSIPHIAALLVTNTYTHAIDKWAVPWLL